MAIWNASLAPDLTAYFGSHVDEIGDGCFVIRAPTIVDVQRVLSREFNGVLCAHWRSPMYDDDDGDDAPWLSYVDVDGNNREDAVVYRIELTLNGEPFSTSDRPTDRDFDLGPIASSGWSLHIRVARDHMPSTTLIAKLSESASIERARIQRIEYH